MGIINHSQILYLIKVKERTMGGKTMRRGMSKTSMGAPPFPPPGTATLALSVTQV